MLRRGRRPHVHAREQGVGMAAHRLGRRRLRDQLASFGHLIEQLACDGWVDSFGKAREPDGGLIAMRADLLRRDELADEVARDGALRVIGRPARQATSVIRAQALVWLKVAGDRSGDDLPCSLRDRGVVVGWNSPVFAES